jgi:hypothetical protein
VTFDEIMLLPVEERLALLIGRYEDLHEYMGNRTDHEKFEMARISDAVMMTLILERWVAQQDCIALRAGLVSQLEESDRLRAALERIRTPPLQDIHGQVSAEDIARAALDGGT